MEYDQGFLSPRFITNRRNLCAELSNPYILLFENDIESMHDLIPILEGCSKAGRSLLIIAKGIGGEALSTLVVNKEKGNIKAVATKLPFFGVVGIDTLEDIAILTGGTVVSNQKGERLDDSPNDCSRNL